MAWRQTTKLPYTASIPAPTPHTAPVQPHRNHGLFSDHYLNVTLPSRQQWQELIYEARPVMEAVTGVLASFHLSDNEAQTERDLVRPVLEILGHTVEVQPALATSGGPKRPDYVFYRDTASLNTNKDHPLTDELLRGRSFAVGEAKYWERPLDVSLKKGGERMGKHPPPPRRASGGLCESSGTCEILPARVDHEKEL